jgi:hypothetical protein
MSTPLFDLYDAPSEEELLTITFLDRLANKLGNPPDLTTEAGLKLMDAVIGVWQKHFTQESKDWIHDRALDMANEKSLSYLASNKSAGYNPATYPPQLFKLIKTMFPDLKLQNRKVFMKLIQIYPNLFKTSNYV